MSVCSSCGAEIIWAITNMRRKPFPVEAQLRLGGNVRLVEEEGDLVAYVVDPNPGELGYVSHFATCPHASEWRKP